MIPVEVTNVSISNVGFVLLLKNPEDERTLPIFIGVPEAQAIAILLNKVEVPRPLTHDLLKNVLDILEARLDRVEVHDLEDGTFFGRLVLFSEGREIKVDSRPSDAVALALRCRAPILVHEKVMDEAGIVLEDKADAGKAVVQRPKSRLEELKAELAKAIEEERYEQAAILRDRIKELSKPESN
ncbi:MAG: hypothetical protein GXP31_14895 [Kiritimatiellaeota bacterium]|nr:hypothetical protein [Kiritimatiellota bacterium]